MRQATSDKQQATSEKRRGLVYVFTGDGKGKTSAAFWTGMRAAMAGKKVAVVQWYKEERWPTAEQKIAKIFTSTKSTKGSFDVYTMGKGFRIANSKFKIQNSKLKIAPLKSGGIVVDTATEQEHKKAANDALKLARKLVGKVDVLILDEVNNAVADKLIKVDEVIKVIEKRGKTHLILTGRRVHPKIVKIADLVTECKKIKHPFDKGKMAVKGLDY